VYLKSITLKGFKSFASSTTLNFEPGITCVVGPNGSGKSNVLDALSWVMGEQGAKSLRGGKMEDVIFAGTSGRAPLGRAEVSVTIDNTDQTLPIDFTEVTISRVLFRNGTSEYLLNGDTTRLLDIQELLSDSGIGREMHVIVGQGQLDAILLANPEERRAFIEEAAGVLKHRKRKEKALRKLDSMQGNLSRIQDLTVELRRNLKPLGKQAEVARKASTIQSDLRDSRLRLLADDLITIKSTLDAEVADETVLRARRDEVEAELRTIRQREEELEQISALENPMLVEAQETFYRLTAQREKFRGIQSLASERARFLSEGAEEARSSGRDPQAMDAEAATLRGEESSLKIVLAEATAALAAMNEKLRLLESELAGEENGVSAALRAIADQREGTARQEGHINALRSRIDATSAEITRLTAAREEAQDRLKRSRGDFASLEGEIASLDATEPDLDQKYEGAKLILNDLLAKVATLHEEEQGAQRERSGLTARLSALQESLTHRDGGEAVLSGRSEARVKGRLASLISITPGWEAAVAAALGTLADSIVVEDMRSAVSALGMLKAESSGRSELLVVEDNGEVASASIPAGLTPIMSLLSTQGIDQLVGALLGRIVAVETLADAEAAIAQDRTLIAVTRDGDLVSRNRVRGGSSGSQSTIEINALLERTQSDLDAVTARCESLTFSLAALNNELDSARSAHDIALAGLNDSDAKMSGLAEQMAVAGQNVKSAQAEVDRVRKIRVISPPRSRNLNLIRIQRSRISPILKIFAHKFPPHVLLRLKPASNFAH
jgi:chromosome segregation protein